MHIHFTNINFPNSYIENKINNKFKKVTENNYIYIFSPDGIFRFDGNKLEKYYEKINPSNKNITNDFKDILIDDNITFFRETYQIPLEHILVDKVFIEYQLCYNTKIVLEKEDGHLVNLYLDTGNDIDTIENDISYLLTLFT